jgi:hypothetical protein
MNNKKPRKSNISDMLANIKALNSAQEENALAFDHIYQIDQPMEELEQTPLYRLGFDAGVIQERERAKHVIEHLLQIYKDPVDE